MISGKTPLFWICLWMILSASAWASDAPQPQPQPRPPDSTATRLIASLGRPAPARTAFAEARFMKVLERPLLVSGELAWLGGDRLQRRVDQPKPELASIADGQVTQQRPGHPPRSFSLQRAPQLQLLLDSFVALLSGDPARLDDAFDVALSGAPAGHWQLQLQPRDASLAKSVSVIRVDGDGDEARCLQVQEADGDLSIDLLGPLAGKMPARPDREALSGLCQGPR